MADYASLEKETKVEDEEGEGSEEGEEEEGFRSIRFGFNNKALIESLTLLNEDKLQ